MQRDSIPFFTRPRPRLCMETPCAIIFLFEDLILRHTPIRMNKASISEFFFLAIIVLGGLVGIIPLFMFSIPLGVVFVGGIGGAIWLFLRKMSRDFGAVAVTTVAKDAVPVDAIIVGLKENGSSITLGGAVPKAGVTLELEIHPKDGPAYRAQTNAFLSILEVQKYQAGATVAVLVDPKNLQSVALRDASDPLELYRG